LTQNINQTFITMKTHLKKERPPNKKRSFSEKLNNLSKSFNQNKTMKILSIILCFLFFTSLKAQNTTYQEGQDNTTTQTNHIVNTEFKTKMNNLFGQLEKNRVPHGVLLDFGMEFANVTAYNGTITDSTYTNAFTLKQLYNTLLSSRIRNVSEGFVTPQEFNNRWQNNRKAIGVVSISGLYFKYAKFDDDALSNNKITHSNNKLYDKYTNGTWQNPYQEQQTFAMAPAIKKFSGFNLDVKIPSSIFYSNAQAQVQSIEIDFDNGQGYVTMPFNQNIAVTYHSKGIKTWTYKLNLTNGTVLYNQSKILIQKGLNAVPYTQNRANQANPSDQTNTNTIFSNHITATIPFKNKYGKVSITLDDALSNGAGIKKPLIVAEGFDIGTFFGGENENGNTDYTSFQKSVLKSNSTELRALLSGNSLIFGDQEYDIIYVDWDNGTDYMERNAYALEAVINWVNQEKLANGSTEPNVILGQSMGGVITRYALADMEERGENHDTRLFISQDAPQQGANIPVAFQYFARHIENQYVATGQTLFGNLVTLPILDNNVDLPIGLLDKPASKQLLKNWVNYFYDINNDKHNEFYTKLKTKGLNGSNGYPLNCRNVAISNGSECGSKQDFNAGSPLFDFQRNKSISVIQSLLVQAFSVLGVDYINSQFLGVSLISSLPGSSRYIIDFKANSLYGTQGHRIYKGRVAYRKKIFWVINVNVEITNVNKNQPNGILPFDNFGGGYYPMDNLSDFLLDGAYINDKFSFIPTVSSLDIGTNKIALSYTDYVKEYVGATPPTGIKSSPFINFSTEFNKYNANAHNKPHISFNPRNGDWLAGELNAGSNVQYTDCASFCSDSEDFNIVGNEVVCPNGCDYSLTNNTFNVDWTIIEGSNLVTAIATNNSINLKQANPNQNGFITLQSRIREYHCGEKTSTKRIWVGTPSYPQEFSAVDLNFPDTPTNYLLELSKPTDGNSNQGEVLDREYQIFPSNMIVSEDQWSSWVRTPSNAGIYLDYSYRYKNQCGWSEWSWVHGETVDLSGGDNWGRAEPYPNSSDSSFKVDLSEKPVNAQFYIYLFDQYQNIMYQGQCNNVEKTINTLNLQDGVYYLHLYENGELKTKQILVGH